KEDGEVCTTPCTVDAPIGETPIIVEAENRRSIIENLVVPRKTARPMRVLYKLKPALGAIVIEGGDGAAILIDEQTQGFAPRRFDDIVAAGPPAGVRRTARSRKAALSGAGTEGVGPVPRARARRRGSGPGAPERT